jgi:hypothetical protein
MTGAGVQAGLVLLACLVMYGCSRTEKTEGRGRGTAQLEELARELDRGEISTIEVTQISLSREFIVSVLPEMFADNWKYKFIIRDVGAGDPRREKMASTLRAAVVQDESAPGDLRWKLAFYSTGEKLLCALYFDALGRRGLTGSVPVAFRMDFLFRLRSALDLSFDTIP